MDCDGWSRLSCRNADWRNNDALVAFSCLGANDQRSDHWLVIVHSSKLRLNLRHPRKAHRSGDQKRSAGFSPIALNSSRYKQLMPCWKILIAGSSAKKSTARALSKKLTASGIDNYVKQAGKYVGADPRIDRMCNNAAQQVPDSPYAIAQTSNGGVLVRIPVREPTLQHLIERYDQTLREQDRYGYELWMEKLPVETVDAARAGQNFQVLALRQGAEPQSCSVEHFVLAEEGVSVGYPDEVDGKKPALPVARAQVYAFLSCLQPFSTSESSSPPKLASSNLAMGSTKLSNPIGSRRRHKLGVMPRSSPVAARRCSCSDPIVKGVSSDGLNQAVHQRGQQSVPEKILIFG